MSKYSLQDSFLEFCKKNKFEVNTKQVEIIKLLDNFLNPKKNYLIYFQNHKKIRVFIFMEKLV